MIRPGRRALAALLPALAMLPAIAAAQDQCRAIRGLTNMDGRSFADLVVGIDRNPRRMSVRVGRAEALPTPEDCSLSADSEALELTCYWRPGGYAAANAFFDSLFARFQRCLGDRLTAPAGPRPYGDAAALRESVTDLPVAGGETKVELRLIEARETTIPGYHYVTLSVSHTLADEE